MKLLLAGALGLSLSASVRAQVRVETVARPAAPGGVAVLPAGSMPTPLSLSSPALGPALNPPLSVSIAPAPSAVASAVPAALAAPSVAQAAPAALLAAPAAAVSAPAEGRPDAAPESAVSAAADPATETAAPASSSSGRRGAPAPGEGATWRFLNLPFFGGRMWDGARPLEKLGQGVMGSVHVHPSRSGAVVKVAHAGYADAVAAYFMSDETVLRAEDRGLNRLADAGAAPRTLARLTVSGRPASVRERIFGKTVLQLRRQGAFGKEERALVQELLERVAAGGSVADDLNLGNIMIGTREGETQRRAFIVDTLNVDERLDLGRDERLAGMLAEPVPWIAFQGLGLHRSLSSALDGSVASYEGLFATPSTPRAWSKTRRYATLAGLLGALAFVPPLAHALAPAGLSYLGAFPSWPMLALAAAAIGLAGIPLRLFVHGLAPWVMRRSKDQGVGLLRDPAWKAFPLMAIAAFGEEFLFRGVAFIGAALLLLPHMPALAAFGVAALASSLAFALVHGYGPVWTRVVGGLLYAGALLVSGSLVLPIAAHFAFNAAFYVYGRYLK